MSSSALAFRRASLGTPATTQRPLPLARRPICLVLAERPRAGRRRHHSLAAARADHRAAAFCGDEDEDDEAAPTLPLPLPTPLPPLQSSLDGNRLVAVDVEERDPVLASLFRQAEASPPQVLQQQQQQEEAAAADNDDDAADAATATDADMLKRLAAWRARHGTSHVPRRVHDAADLGEWLWRQRRARRRGGLPAWLAQAMDALGVDWRPAPEALRWHAAYHAARRARAAGALPPATMNGQEKEEQEQEQEGEEDDEEGGQGAGGVAGGWAAARAFAAAGRQHQQQRDEKERRQQQRRAERDPLHDAALDWLGRQAELTLASSPGLAPHHGAAATAAERREMLRRLGPGLEARARRSAVADAAAMAGLNAHERKLERRRRRAAERAREERREARAAELQGAAARARDLVRAEDARREALRPPSAPAPADGCRNISS